MAGPAPSKKARQAPSAIWKKMCAVSVTRPVLVSRMSSVLTSGSPEKILVERPGLTRCPGNDRRCGEGP